MTAGRETPVSLWDALDVTEYGPVRDMRVHPATTRDVDEFCRRWHYTETGGNMMWRYGLYQDAVLVGVVAYNLPTMETCQSVLGPDLWLSVLHMGRLVCAEDAPRNVESRLIAGSLRSLKRDRPETRAVLTYAAQDQHHVGYVYQATNALYTGLGGDSHYFVDATGRRRATFLDGKAVSSGRAIDLGWTRRTGAPKHRYVYLLGNKTERKEARALLQLPVLPYPKAVTA